MNEDKIIKGLDCCLNWEEIPGTLPECESCPYSNSEEGTCPSMKPMLTDARALILAQKKELEELYAGIRALKKAVEEA